MSSPYFVPRFSGPEYFDVDVKAPDYYSTLPTDETSPPDGFLIGFTVKDNIRYYSYEADDDEWLLDRISFGSVHTNLSFHASRETLTPVLPTISNMLEVINIPREVHAHFIQIIQGTLLSFATDPDYASPRIVPILVEITAWYSHDISNIQSFSSDDEMETYAGTTARINDLLNLSLEEHVPIATPAATSAIESLPKVKFDDLNDHQTNCIICLEDFLQDAQLTSMPCRHVFHEECITNWLQNSNLCPLCRFEMPVDPRG